MVGGVLQAKVYLKFVSDRLRYSESDNVVIQSDVIQKDSLPVVVVIGIGLQGVLAVVYSFPLVVEDLDRDLHVYVTVTAVKGEPFLASGLGRTVEASESRFTGVVVVARLISLMPNNSETGDSGERSSVCAEVSIA